MIIDGWNKEEVKSYRVFDRWVDNEGNNRFYVRGEGIPLTTYVSCFSSKEYPDIIWAYFGDIDSIDQVNKHLKSCRENSGLPFELPLTGELDMDLFESILGYSDLTEVWCADTIDYVDDGMSRDMFFTLRRSI